MDKGYSISRINGKIVTEVDNIEKGSVLETKMKNGTVISLVQEVKKNGRE